MANTKLVIVESPSKARTIAKYLGRGYKVEASNGHVRDLPKSQMGVDVDHDFEPKYITIRGRGEILDRIRKDARAASKVYLATDPDREGEAISWHLAYVLGIDPKDACRVEFNEITSKAVKAAIKKPRAIDLNLVDAQQARRVLDRLVGYTISPLLWQKVKKGLSAGRVQSVATRIICDREREIEDFIPQEYWTIDGNLKGGGVKLTARLAQLNGQNVQLNSGEEARAAIELIKAQKYAISAVRRSEKRKNPAPPFTTSNLQQEASRKLGFTTQKTMQVAQQLYEGVDISGEGTQGLISYIRTDSTRISDEAIAAVRTLIQERYGDEYLPETPNVYKSRKTAQDAHEAIRPTDVMRLPDAIKASLTRDQYKLYKLVWERFVSSQMTPALLDSLSVDITGGPVLMRFSGSRKKFAGFSTVYEETLDDQPEEKDVKLPELKEGMEFTLESAEPEQHFTQPAPRFTEASLIRELEEKGIGRPSTYAPTITTILARGYIARENRRLIPTELGIIITDLMKQYFADIVDIEFTANMEQELDEVEEGQLEWRKVIGEFYGPFRQTFDSAAQAMEKVQLVDEESDVICDKCGARMVYKLGRFGRFLACPNFPECRNTKTIQKDTGATCPKCGGRILEKQSRKGRRFYGCENYPECEFVSWDLPVNEPCPQCGALMVLKRSRKNGTQKVCTNPQCNYRSEPLAEEAEI